jgi:hypothetical protein
MANVLPMFATSVISIKIDYRDILVFLQDEYFEMSRLMFKSARILISWSFFNIKKFKRKMKTFPAIIIAMIGSANGLTPQQQMERHEFWFLKIMRPIAIVQFPLSSNISKRFFISMK